MKVVINAQYGGFGLSDKAYEKLIEWGVPVQKYIGQERGDDGRYLPQPANDGEVIFDNELIKQGEDDSHDRLYHAYKHKASIISRYWDSWTRESRSHPLIIKVVETLGESANGRCADLKIVEIPDDVEWEVDEYNGFEHIAEKHRIWEYNPA